MWLAKKMSRRTVRETGIGRAADGAVIGGGAREDGLYCLPFGYYALPQENSPLLLIQAEERQVCCGTLHSPQMQAGEILIQGAGGSYIRLTNDGKIILGGELCRADGTPL